MQLLNSFCFAEFLLEEWKSDNSKGHTFLLLHELLFLQIQHEMKTAQQCKVSNKINHSFVEFAFQHTIQNEDKDMLVTYIYVCFHRVCLHLLLESLSPNYIVQLVRIGALHKNSNTVTLN